MQVVDDGRCADQIGQSEFTACLFGFFVAPVQEQWVGDDRIANHQPMRPERLFMRAGPASAVCDAVIEDIDARSCIDLKKKTMPSTDTGMAIAPFGCVASLASHSNFTQCDDVRNGSEMSWTVPAQAGNVPQQQIARAGR